MVVGKSPMASLLERRERSMASPAVEKATIYSALKFQQLEADDLKRSSESTVRNLNMEPVEPELSFEALEKKRCVSSGLPWPHIHYDSVSDMPKGINYIRLSSGWRCLSSVRVIELRLSRDCCLNDFPGYGPLKPLSLEFEVHLFCCSQI